MLEEGAKVFLYTDGVIERKNQEGKLYGPDRLYALFESHRNDPIDRIISEVHKSLGAFGQGFPSQDDISIIGFEFQKRQNE